MDQIREKSEIDVGEEELIHSCEEDYEGQPFDPLFKVFDDKHINNNNSSSSSSNNNNNKNNGNYVAADCKSDNKRISTDDLIECYKIKFMLRYTCSGGIY